MSSINGISFGGLASGLDTQSIISQLLAVERRPISLLEAKKKTFQAKKSLYGDLDGLLDKLHDATKDLRLTSTFLDFDAKTSDEDKHLTASASSTATAGKHEIVVGQLAQARTRTTLGSTDSDTTRHGAGLLRFDFNDARPSEFINIPDSQAEPSSLDNIASAINAKDIGIQASVVNTGIGNAPYKLVLTSTEPGTDNDFTVSTDAANNDLIALASELTNDNSIAAKQAQITFNGVPAERSTNSISDLIEGVTIDLAAVHATGEKTTITITPNAEETGKKVKAFVDAYNEVVDFISNQQKLISGGSSSSSSSKDEEVKSNPLFGESSIRTIRSTLRSLVGQSIGGNDAYSLFVQIGIESDRDGKLTLNQGKFEEAVIEDPNAVRNMFANEDAGIAVAIYDQIDAWTDSIDGLLAASTKGIDRNVSDINRQIDRAEEKLDAYEVALTQKYANLEITMGRLQAQLGSIANIGYRN
ncbi:MAG: flagellar filament capping protein FliD [Planctomycetes bacterium]|nr:flagellar filament capping protein FliD [Planctomycetota bacterium]MCB9920464.1 flagellar filament capping protein FliD [Planctomycetota bacterium]